MANEANNRPPLVGILTVSDRCYAGTQEDRSGPNLKAIIEQNKGLTGQVVQTKTVPDEKDIIQEILIEWCDNDKLDLIITTGGTGFAERDVTPEATKAVLEKEAPGLALSMLMGSLSVTPLAMLSRPACGIRGKSLIINLPGSKKASEECYEFVLPALPHAIQLLRGETKEVEATHKSMASSQTSHEPSVSHEHKNRKPRRSPRSHETRRGSGFKAQTQKKSNQLKGASRAGPDLHTLNQDSRNPQEKVVFDLEATSDLVVIPASVLGGTVGGATFSHQEHAPAVEGDETGEQITRILKALSQHITEMDEGQRVASQPTGGTQDSRIDDGELDTQRAGGSARKLTSKERGIEHSNAENSCGKEIRKRIGNDILSETQGDAGDDSDGDMDHDRSDDEENLYDASDDDVDPEEDSSDSHSRGNNEKSGLTKNKDKKVTERQEDEEDGGLMLDVANVSRESVIKPSSIENNSVPGSSRRNEENEGDRNENNTYVVFEFDPSDVDPGEKSTDKPQKKKRRIIALARPFGKSQRELRAAKKSAKAKQARDKKSHKSTQTEYDIPVGIPLRNFLMSHHLLKDATLKRGKRSVKRNLVTMKRQEQALAFQTWQRGTLINERCRYDDYFVATTKGEVVRSRMKGDASIKDQYVVAWYLWCSGQGNCLRQCGSYGKCVKGCRGVRHKQDRHNCSVLVTLKLFLSDLQTWKVTISGQHVPEESAIAWRSSSEATTKKQMDEELRDRIYTEADCELRASEIYEKLQNEEAIAGRTLDRGRIIQSVQRRKRLMRTQICKDHHHDITKVARRPRKSPYPMISFDEACAVIMEKAPVLGQHSVSCKDALGYVLANDVTAQHPLPPFRASIKDGYAVICSDGPGPRRVLSDSVAGELPKSELIPGYVIRINTGAQVPEGADAVVEVESTELLKESDGGEIELEVNILTQAKPGQDIRPVGLDIPKDQVILSKGTRLGASELGLLAAVGVTHVPVYQMPKVAVVSTGNELCEPHKQRKKGQIFDSNRTTLLSALRDHGIPCLDMGIAKDTAESLQATLKSAVNQADVVISTGGVSMGERDLLKYCLMVGIHAKVHFGRVFLKPGKPTTFATISSESSQKLFFALPGNPASALVTFNLFVLPAVRKMMGNPKPNLTKVKARVASDIKLDPRPEFQRVKLEWEGDDPIPMATVTGSQMSSRLLSMADANALLMLPPKTDRVQEVKTGSVVDALIIGRL